MAGGADFDDEGEITGINVTPLVDVVLDVVTMKMMSNTRTT